MKTPVIQRKDYTVYFEQDQGFTFVHCDCRSWSKTVKKQLTSDFNVLCSLSDFSLYAIHDKHDNKHFKFLTMFNFKHKLDIMCLDGVERQIFVRVVNAERKV